MIARALVRRPRLIFFDQATSALDNRTQAIVGESLAAMNATRIIIAHRLSTIRGADRIVLLENGRIAETGTYDELIDRGGAFRRLVQRQLL
jgi:ATP-binding cassette subfamily C protein